MDYTYGAFISYRHLPADMAAARAVQEALETFRVPGDLQKKTGRKKLNRCFRDQDELPLADDLGESIEKALRESEWLIVICSPDLPESAWCLREVDFFIGLGRQDRIIPVLIAGDPKESFPPRLLEKESEEGLTDAEPLAADLRGRLKKQLKTERLRIAARMLNLNFNDLKNREQQRIMRRNLTLISSALAVVAGFAGYAVYNNQMLTKERNAAARSATELLLEKSLRSTQEGDLSYGLTQALEAYEGSRIFDREYDSAVSAALEAAMYPEAFSQIGSLKDRGVIHRGASLSNDGKVIACRQADNSVQFYSANTGERMYVIRDFEWNEKSECSPDCRYIFRVWQNAAVLYHLADGTEAASWQPEEGQRIACNSLTVRNEIPVILTENGAAALADPFGKGLTLLEGISLSGTEQDTVLIHRSGRRGAWSDGERTWLVDTESRTVMKVLDAPISWFSGAYTEDGRYYSYDDGDETVYLRWDTLEEVCRSPYGGSLSPDGTLLAAPNGYSGVTLVDAKTGEELWTEGHNSGNTSYSVAFADQNTLIASHSEVQIYRISDRTLVYDSGSERTTYGVDFHAGRLVMPLRSGGCLINLLPEENDALPHRTILSRENCSAEDLAVTTARCPLVGRWNGSTYFGMINGEYVTLDSEEDGLVYQFQGKEYMIHPVRGIDSNLLYVSPDGKWQALLRSGAVDIFRAAEGPEPVLTIPENGYQRLCAALYGDMIALGAYVENLTLYDLNTGEFLGTVPTGAMCVNVSFSPDGKHLIALSAMSARATVASTENLAAILNIPVTDIHRYMEISVGFNDEGTEAMVVYADGRADVGLLYQDLDTLVNRARRYTE